MKKFIIIILSFILCACTTTSSSSNQKEAVIELQPGNGAVKKIPMQDVFNKMADDETFIVLILKKLV